MPLLDLLASDLVIEAFFKSSGCPLVMMDALGVWNSSTDFLSIWKVKGWGWTWLTKPDSKYPLIKYTNFCKERVLVFLLRAGWFLLPMLVLNISKGNVIPNRNQSTAETQCHHTRPWTENTVRSLVFGWVSWSPHCRWERLRGDWAHAFHVCHGGSKPGGKSVAPRNGCP